VQTDDPQSFALRIQIEILAATRLHYSVGISDNKVRAKIATGFGKPRGPHSSGWSVPPGRTRRAGRRVGHRRRRDRGSRRSLHPGPWVAGRHPRARDIRGHDR
jgi:hypothetical protein